LCDSFFLHHIMNRLLNTNGSVFTFHVFLRFAYLHVVTTTKSMKKIYSLAFAFALGSFAFGQSNNAIHFDGVDDYISTNGGAITGANSRTVEAWIRTDANANPSDNGSQQVIVDMGATGTGTRYTLCLLWSNSVRVEIGGGGVSANVAINDSSWHHVAAVFNSTALTKHRLYIDGAQVATGNITTTLNTSSGPILIGRRVDNVKYFNGDIDEVRVWKKALTTAEIQAHYQQELCDLPSKSDLKHYYTFNSGTADGSNAMNLTLNDLKGNQDGTLNNFTLSGSSSNWTYGQNLSTTIYDSTSLEVCQGMWSPDQSTYWDTTGTYSWTYAAANGCDSVVSIALNVNSVDTSVSISLSSPPVWTSNESDPTATFQWVNYDDSTAISGATTASYTPTANGRYAVVITKENCEVWSSMVEITNLSTEEHMLDLVAYPNPTQDWLHINRAEGTRVQIYATSGALLKEVVLEGQRIDVSQFPAGTYLVATEHQKTFFVKL